MRTTARGFKNVGIDGRRYQEGTISSLHGVPAQVLVGSWIICSLSSRFVYQHRPRRFLSSSYQWWLYTYRPVHCLLREQVPTLVTYTDIILKQSAIRRPLEAQSEVRPSLYARTSSPTIPQIAWLPLDDLKS